MSSILESWGSGSHRIIEACHEQGVEDPTWRWDGEFVYVSFKRPVEARETAKENLGDNVAPNVAPSTDNVAQSLNERILQIIKSNPSIRREDIAAQLFVNKKTVERHLKYLGVNWEGYSKTGHWNIPLPDNMSMKTIWLNDTIHIL